MKAKGLEKSSANSLKRKRKSNERTGGFLFLSGSQVEYVELKVKQKLGPLSHDQLSGQKVDLA